MGGGFLRGCGWVVLIFSGGNDMFISILFIVPVGLCGRR
jgi:hypothetical protein